MENTVENVVNQAFDAVVAQPAVAGEEPAEAKVDRRKGVRKTNDPAAPYGYKADGVTPRSKPGRRPKAVEAA
jgi:hypothetical protein